MPIPRPDRRVPIIAFVLGFAVFGSVTDASGQYFGRNRVNYETFDFQVLETPHFDIYYYAEEEDAIPEAARMAERWYARLSRILDHEFEERQPLILYANHPHFQQTTALSGDISEGTGGVTEAFKQRVILPFAYSLEETDHVLGHELVHAFQYDISGMGRAGAGLEAAAQRFQVPLWFVEGMAEYLSIGPSDPLTSLWLRNAAISGEIPTIRELSEGRVYPYRYGHAIWAYIGGRWGDAAIGQILKLAGEGVPFQITFERILNIDLDELSADWQSSIRRTYLPQLANLREAREDARGLITSERGSGSLNVAPSISPDGRLVAYLAQQESGDVELMLANASTGEVIRRLQRGAGFDAHFGSLRYIHSAGTWAPDGRQFAFSALREGRDVLVILDTERADRIDEFSVPLVGEITNPSWSPDGRSIVFSGISGGITDLYLLNLDTGDTRKLTDDKYAELQPAFSPDGQRIAFSTDRFGTDLDQLKYGAYELGVMEVGTGKIERVKGMGGTKNINPQWSADGAEIFFVSNRSGIPNVYRVKVGTGEVAQITNLFSGVSGITDMSPALSVARQGNRLVFTAFEHEGYNIYALTEGRELAGTPVTEESDSLAALLAGLPPYPRPVEAPFNRVAEYLADYRTGLPSPQQSRGYASRGYRPRLGLDYLGQPSLGVSIGGAFGGVGIYGGVSGIFSDVLGGHQVGALIEAQGQLDEIGGAFQYLNMRGRWNWGASIQRIPYIYGYYAEGFTDVTGGQTFAQQLVRQRVFDSGVMAYARYPFSQVQRVDFSGGFRRISMDQQVLEYHYNPVTFTPIGQREDEVDGPSYNMFETSAAWVYDSAVFSYTSPIAGQRARLEVAPTTGQLQFITARADLRRYFHAEPFTLAIRGFHYGRYGRDSEGIFADVYLGNSSLVRGYDSVYNDCYDYGQDCQMLNHLFGSRVLVANAELRVPVITLSANDEGFVLPPVDAHVFYDAGMAWTSATSPVFSRGIPDNENERGVLTSAGVGIRSNLFGFAVLEVDYVRAFAALDQRWRWVFALQQGF